jgi:NAD(P)-dependent dehydrogenase (short-subunit alcohol dehydrogenase family)
MKLSGLNAVITGANQGLGLSIAQHYVREGANLAICARDAQKLSAATNALRAQASDAQKIVAGVCDVSSETAVRSFTKRAIEELGSVQVLVNNAGVYGPKGPSESVDWSDWVRAIEINLYGVMLPCRALMAHLREQGWGKIINLSGGGATQPMPMLSAYAASKAAVVRLTETLAEELRQHHVDVNAVAPGALNTRLLDEILSAGPEVVGKAFHDKAVKQRDSGGTPLGLGAELCVYLASHESDGITGKLISAQWDPWRNMGKYREVLTKTDIYTLRRIVPTDRNQEFGTEQESAGRP